MNSIRKGLAAVLGAVLAVVPAAAQETSVEGRWETGPRDYRFEVQLCGPTGDDFCGWMTYGLDKDPRIQRYVGQRVFDAAKRIGPATWKGKLFIAGYQADGTITHAEPDRLEIDGCVLFIICGKFNMYREGSTIPR